MNTLPEDIQNTIYKYKHQLEFWYVMDELTYSGSVCYCGRWSLTTCFCECDWSDDSAFDYASHQSEEYDDTDSDAGYPVTTF